MFKKVTQLVGGLARLLAGAGPAAAQSTALTLTSLGSLPDGGRYGMGYCQAQQYFYLVGGGSPSTAYTSTVFRFDATTGSWGNGPLSSGQVAPFRFGTAAVLSDVPGSSPVFVLNGATSTTPLPTTTVLNPTSGLFNSTFSNPLLASTAAMASWNGLLYAYGGQLAGGTYTDQLRVLNPATSTWTTLAAMPEAKTTYGTAVNGKLYAIGGYNGSNSARVDAYDIASGQWQALGTLPTTLSN